ncbi:MAG: hypothetical protein IKN43_08070 [Selenomonadaceae bacterium]|nr:hypothetical protein [Selenomonadaceae bacterium]
MHVLDLREDVEKHIENIRRSLFNAGDNVIGVLLRGTDYISRKLYNHAIQPPIELAMTTVYQKAKEWGCNKIFLATEDKSFVEAFKSIFGNQVVTVPKVYTDFRANNGISHAMYVNDRENDYYLKGLEYLTEMVILSKCENVVMGRTSGTAGVNMMSKGFKNKYYFFLGRYGVVGEL